MRRPSARKIVGTLAGIALLAVAAFLGSQSARAGLAGSRSGAAESNAARAQLLPGPGIERSSDAAAGTSPDGSIRLLGATNGRIELDPILRGISDGLGLARPAATGAGVDLRRVAGALGLDQIDDVTQGLIGVTIDDDGLGLSFDGGVITRTWNRFFGNLSQWWRSGVRHASRAQMQATQWAMTWFDGQHPAAPPSDEEMPRRAVVLVHGLDEPGWIWDDLAPALCDAGLTAVQFEYPNDGPLAPAADGLGEALLALRKHGVEEVDLVAHSMGGLVVRDLLTRPRWYDSNGHGGDDLPRIRRMITVGTPNHGAAVARLQVLSEAKDQAIRALRAATGRSDHRLSDVVLHGLRDGHGQASHDLQPGSAYLSDLNARPLPSDVRMTVIAGRMLEPPTTSLAASAESPAGNSALMATAARCADALCTLGAESGSSWLGDGLVTLDSAMLPGIDDIVVVPGNHQSILMKWRPGEVPPAVEVIVDRLTRE